MVNALAPLQRVAAGKEVTPGTAVAATRLMPHIMGSSYTEGLTQENLDEARGVLADVDDVATRRMSTLELQQYFDFDLCLLAFLCGIADVTGAPTPTATATHVTNSAGYMIGATDITVASTAGFNVGDYATFPQGEPRKISAKTNVTFSLSEGISAALADNDAVTRAAAPFTYTFDAGIAAVKSKASATFEVLQTDGVTDRVSRKFAHARPTSMALAWAIGGMTTLNTTWMGAAGSDVAKTDIATSTIAGRKQVPAELWRVAINDTWAALGSTYKGNVRALSWSFSPGLEQSYHLRGREHLDSDGWYDGKKTGAVSLTLDLDAAAVSEITKWRDGDLRFIRLDCSNKKTGVATRSAQIDQCVRILTPPNLLAYDGQQGTVALECEMRSDASGPTQNMLSIAIKSGLDAWVAGNLP